MTVARIARRRIFALRVRGIEVDTKGFDSAMERQKEEARRAWKGSGEAATETIWFEVREQVGPTEFLGYETETAEGVVKAVIVLRVGHNASDALAAEIQDFVKSRIAGYKYPRQVEFVAELPKTPSGKIKRRLLRS